MKTQKITIVGAGIGGLTTALALRKQGFDVAVFERFTQFKDLGAGIMMANNAMQVFEKLELTAEIQKNGNTFNSLNILTKDFKPLSSSDTTAYSSNKIKPVAIHRSKLQRILLDAFPSEQLKLGKALKKVEQSADKIQLFFEDETTHVTDCLIGADGIHSAVRKSIFPDTGIRNANQVCWRGVVEFDLPVKYRAELNEIWAKGKRFGFVSIGRGLVYWYALVDHKEEEVLQRQEVIGEFKDGDPLMVEIMSATPPEKWKENPITDLSPINQWHVGNTGLMGDAAHATTPNLGQGACQAIEDAWALACCFAENTTPEAAFTAFEEARMKKAHKVVNMSWRVGKMAQLTNPVGVFMRNFLLKNMPQSMLRKQNEWLYQVFGV